MNRAIHQSVNPLTSQSSNQTTNESINQRTNQSMLGLHAKGPPTGSEETKSWHSGHNEREGYNYQKKT